MRLQVLWLCCIRLSYWPRGLHRSPRTTKDVAKAMGLHCRAPWLTPRCNTTLITHGKANWSLHCCEYFSTGVWVHTGLKNEDWPLRINSLCSYRAQSQWSEWSAFPLPLSVSSCIYTLVDFRISNGLEASTEQCQVWIFDSWGTKVFQVSSKPSFTEALDPWETMSRFTRTKGICNTKGLGAVWNLQSQVRITQQRFHG